MKLYLDERSLIEKCLPSDAAQAYYWDTELRGFGVVVGRTGARTFVARRRVNGRLVKRTIGRACDTLTVEAAREEARAIIGELRPQGGVSTDEPRRVADDLAALMTRALRAERKATTGTSRAPLHGRWDSKERARDYWLRRQYGLSSADWDRLFKDQGSACACCRRQDPGSAKGWQTDHDHRTGRVRGILCVHCNWLLGRLGDGAKAVAESCRAFLAYLAAA